MSGRRALNKSNNLDRIVAAADELFGRRDYDDTTMGEIAKLANVATGTLFNYADNKRDLVFLVFNGGFEAAVDQASSVPDDVSLIDQLMAIFGTFYAFYDGRRAIAVILLREIFFFTTGKQAQQSVALVERMRSEIARRLANTQKAGKLRAGIDTLDAADVCYAIYQIEVRRWIAGAKLDIGTGLRRLRSLLELALNGMSTVRH